MLLLFVAADYETYNKTCLLLSYTKITVVCPSVRNGRSPEVALTPKLGSLYPSTEKLSHLGNSVIESAWHTTAHSRVVNIREHARHV